MSKRTADALTLWILQQLRAYGLGDVPEHVRDSIAGTIEGWAEYQKRGSIPEEPGQ